MTGAQEHRLHFRGLLGPPSAACPILVQIQWDRFNPESLSVVLNLLGDRQVNVAAHRVLRVAAAAEVRIDGRSEEDTPRSAVLKNINGLSTDGAGQVTVHADTLYVDFPPLSAAAAKTYFMKAHLTPGGLAALPAILEYEWNGDIKINRTCSDPIEVTVVQGNWEVAVRYEHYDSSACGDKVVHRVERTMISGNVTAPQDMDFIECHESCVRKLDAICLILSLCYRQPVRIYDVEYLPQPDPAGNGWGAAPHARYRQRALERQRHPEELIDSMHLIHGGLDRLVAAFERHEAKDTLRRAIVFLAAAHGRESLETKYFLSFAALDLLVGLCAPGSRSLLPTAQWRDLRRQIADTIDRHCDDCGLQAIARQMKCKLPELQRAPAVDATLDAVRSTGVPIGDLWRSQGFEVGVRHATNLRNSLFHRALVEDAFEMYGAGIRIRTLAERLVMSLLNWPMDQIFRWQDQQLRWLESDEQSGS